ncbi:hypothetical protein NGRA_1659 [Nosema granulosis]|uniref:Uncharacterized protein n=1 Tax=Nosema granulosis TaxID=83296 RepID=A0A9P6GY26_9MICR|nr:hypothetical protein NGRA_1659 [Nosema granulosis]
MLISESKNSQTISLASRGPQYLTQPEKARNTEKTFESVKFTINLGEESGIEAPRRTIYVFTDHNIQDVLSWTQSVRKLARLNNWTPELGNKMLDILIDERYQEAINDKRTLDTKLDALCDKVFSLDDYSMYRNMISTARRSEFHDMITFVQYLEDLRTCADLCCKTKNDRLPEREVLDKLISTLSPREKECLIYNQATTLEEIKEVLTKLSTMENFYQVRPPLK